MIAKEQNGLKYYQFESFNELGIKHGFFTRLGGVSPQPFASLNMATTVGDSRENVMENLSRMFNVFGLELSSRYDGWQYHSSTVICTDKPRDIRCNPLRADGLVTSNPEVTLVMRFGDCVPVILYDTRRKVIGIYHAGWQGTVGGICASTVHAMQKMYGCNPVDLIAGIGPSIGPDHFVVKEDVASRFRTVFPEHYTELCGISNGETRLDLWKANRILLENEGVKAISTGKICTVCNTNEWFSHRGDHGKTGRFGVLLSMR